MAFRSRFTTTSPPSSTFSSAPSPRIHGSTKGARGVGMSVRAGRVLCFVVLLVVLVCCSFRISDQKQQKLQQPTATEKAKKLE